MKRFPFVLVCLAITFFSHAQNVGIGTPTPNARLSVASNGTELTGTAMSNILRTNAGNLGTTTGSELPLGSIGFISSNNSALGIRAYRSSAGTDWTTTALILGYDVDNTVRASPGFLTLSANGNVGIGTTNPQKNLSIQNGMNIDQADANSGTIINAISFGNNSGEGIGSKRNAGGNLFGLDFYTNAASRMSITNGGNVGIGTTSPAAKLQVLAGDASFALFGPNVYGAMLYVGSSPTNQSAALSAQVMVTDGDLHIDPASTSNIYIGYFQARDIFLNPNGGYVGIGTASAPTATLDVNGYTKLGSDAPSIKTKMLTGTTAATDGGYVFIQDGIDISKILSFSVMVLYSSEHWIGPNYGVPNYNFRCEVSGSDIYVQNVSGSCSNILSSPIRIFIIYEE